MPELPEVETVRRGLEPHLVGQRIEGIVARRLDLRWPIPLEALQSLRGQTIEAVHRRAKYLLLTTTRGSAIFHLGMSGTLRILPTTQPHGRHDHVDLLLAGGRCLRFNDPRRFGCLLWQAAGKEHPQLAGLGPEPLGPEFDGAYLYAVSRGRRTPVKVFLMDQSVVVGIGNIYAAEALFAAGIDPRRPAGRIGQARYMALAEAVRRILDHAVHRGGTTLRDFLAPDGAPGYFEQELAVYGRAGQPCRRCGERLRALTLAQRSTVFCARCQR